MPIPPLEQPPPAGPPAGMARWLCWAPLGIALAFLTLDALGDLFTPGFYGDAGHRLNYAYQLTLRLGSRIYLPFLQAHILLGYLLHVPLFVYKLIPLGYAFVFLFFLHKIYAKVTKGTAGDLVFETILLVGAAFHPLINGVTTQLYQEVPSIALMYALIYLFYFRPRAYIAFGIVGLCALYCREHLWILFGVFGLIAVMRRRVSFRDPFLYVYGALGLSVLAWLVRTRQITGLRVNVEDNAVTPVAILDRAFNILRVIHSAQLWPLLGAALLAVVIFWFYRKRSSMKWENPFPGYIALSLVSAGLTCAYVIVADPWQYTPGSSRAMFPVMIHIPLWLVMLYARSKSLPLTARRASMVILSVGIAWAAGVSARPERVRSADFSYQREVSRCVSEYRAERGVSTRLLIGLSGIDYWYYADYLSGPMLYEKREENVEEHREGAEIVFASPQAALPGYKPCASFTLPNAVNVSMLLLQPRLSAAQPE